MEKKKFVNVVSGKKEQTFRTEEADRIVRAVTIWTLLLIQAPEPHWGVCMDRLPGLTGWDPFSGSGFNGPWSLTHSRTVIESDGLQLFIVSITTRVVNIEPCSPLVVF